MDDYTPQPVDGLTGSAQADHVLAFVGRTQLSDIPETVRAHARYLLLDLVVIILCDFVSMSIKKTAHHDIDCIVGNIPHVFFKKG